MTRPSRGTTVSERRSSLVEVRLLVSLTSRGKNQRGKKDRVKTKLHITERGLTGTETKY